MMSNQKFGNLGVGLPAWSAALREHGYDQIVEDLADDKIRGIRALARLGLPRYRTEIVSAPAFVEDPTPTFTALDLERYHAVLNHRGDNTKRKRSFGLTKEEATQFVLESLSPTERNNYDVILQESFIHCYGGNIVCSQSGTVLLELIQGELGHNDLVTSRRNPHYRVHRDPITRLFRTVVDSQFGPVESDLPAAVWRTITSVPHRLDNEHSDSFLLRGMDFEPGYYEFYIDRRTPDSKLEPFFIEYSDRSLFIV